MLVAPEELPAAGIRLAGTVATPADDTGALPAGTVLSFAVHVQPLRGDVVVEGWIHAVPRLACDRCLVAFGYRVDRSFRAVFRPGEAALVDEEVELDEADTAVDYYAGGRLDVRAALVEQVLLGLPMKLLCSEDCRGLCPSCGADRNRETCGCGPPTDPRLAPLARLRGRL